VLVSSGNAITIYEDGREIIVTYISTSGLQKQSNKAGKGQINTFLALRVHDHDYVHRNRSLLILLVCTVVLI